LAWLPGFDWLSSNGKSIIGLGAIEQQSLGDRWPEADSASLTFSILWRGVGKESFEGRRWLAHHPWLCDWNIPIDRP